MIVINSGRIIVDLEYLDVLCRNITAFGRQTEL